ncbi:hypothetical protein ABCS02_01690 [Microbacterium sp. X-17]|uniref:hypothetical protein n=1 Tax=Microbacterium sp. X-17 TaxID=3144404 RepID=UPI0031F51232
MSNWSLRAISVSLASAAVSGGLFVAWRYITWARYAPSDVCRETPPATVARESHVWPGLHDFPLYYQCSYLDDATGLWRNTTQGWEFNWIALGSVLAFIVAFVLFRHDHRLRRAGEANPAL